VSFERIPLEHWLGSPEEYEARIIAVAAKLRTMAETGEGPIYQKLGTWLSRVALEERHAEEVVIESPGDTSLYARRTNEPFCLGLYETVQEFLNAECTGNTVATYCSGHGIGAESYMDIFPGKCLSALCGTLREDYPDLVESDGRGISDEILDSLLMEGADEFLFYGPFLERPLRDTISYRQMALQEIAMDHRERDFQREENERVEQALLQLAGNFTARIEAFAGRTKFEKSNYQKLTWYLDELSKSVGKEVVRAALHFASISTSISVGEQLRKRYPVPSVTLDSRSRSMN
jgi:hypothetical protein